MNQLIFEICCFPDLPHAACLNVHQDMPTEVLHTILLGVVKYFWGQTMHVLTHDKKLDIFQVWLHSVASNGLNIPWILTDYMCQYRGSLNGKHFKTIVQIIAYTIYDCVSKDLLDAWLLLRRLTILLWHTEIVDLNVYLVSKVSSEWFYVLIAFFQEELKQVIDDFLTITAKCAPMILQMKPKFHFLVHLLAFIRQFGPALLFATERYESFNSVFQLTSIHSNQAATSWDAAHVFTGLDRVKHLATGGWWYDQTLNTWKQASEHILRMIATRPEYSRLLGFNAATSHPTGLS